MAFRWLVFLLLVVVLLLLLVVVVVAVVVVKEWKEDWSCKLFFVFVFLVVRS